MDDAIHRDARPRLAGCLPARGPCREKGLGRAPVAADSGDGRTVAPMASLRHHALVERRGRIGAAVPGAMRRLRSHRGWIAAGTARSYRNGRTVFRSLLRRKAHAGVMPYGT